MSESTPALYDCRVAYAEALVALAEQDPRIVVVLNDSLGSGKMGDFARRFPKRLFNVGIAEQDMVGIAAGLANGGLRPVVSSASCFLTGRALEQIKADVAYSRAPVVLAAMSPGVAYGALGATHHAIEDLAWMRALANLTILAPADAQETAQAIRAALEIEGPVFLRISRMKVPAVHPADYRLQIGVAARLREGRDITLVACGTMVSRALDAATLLAAGGIEARVLNMSSIAPLDCEAVVAAAQETGGIVTVEEHSTRGGLGGAVAEVLAQEHPAPMRILGVPGVFCPSGPTEWILEHFGLTPEGIRDAALDLLARRSVGREDGP